MKTEAIATIPQAPESAHSIGAKLADVIEGAEKEVAKSSAQSAVFESAHKPKDQALPDWFGQMTETTWIADAEIVPAAKKLREELSLWDKRAEHGFLMQANDLTETNRHTSFRLFVTAKRTLAEWERQNEVNFASLRSEANRVLQGEKERGSRNKTITDADVTSKMAELFPDEWILQERRKSDAKATVEVFEDLFKAWESRCRTLNTMLTKSR